MSKVYKTKYIDISYQPLLSKEIANELLDECESLNWKNKNRRSNITFGDKGLVYKVEFSENTIYRKAISWDKLYILQKIKKIVEEYTREKYNFCAIMRYPNGDSVIKKHRDKEMSKGIIAGVSIGSKRRIVFTPLYNVNDNPISITLKHGSLYTMSPPTNDYWCHEIPKGLTKRVRYSLTFRKLLDTLTTKDIPVYPKCIAILKSGNKKGEKCNNNVKNGGQYCGIHKR